MSIRYQIPYRKKRSANGSGCDSAGKIGSSAAVAGGVEQAVNRLLLILWWQWKNRWNQTLKRLLSHQWYSLLEAFLDGFGDLLVASMMIV
jgi:hypothetical protein